MGQRCDHCGTELDVDWRQPWFRSGKHSVFCPGCGAEYRNNNLPILFGVMEMPLVTWPLALIVRIGELALWLGFLAMFGVISLGSWLKPVRPRRPLRKEPESRWYRTPLPYLALGLLVVWYLMFKH